MWPLRWQVIDRNVKRAMDPTTAASKELMYAALGLGVGVIVGLGVGREPMAACKELMCAAYCPGWG